MEVKSTYKFARVSAKKARDVARAIQGLPVSSALDTLNFTPKKSAFLIGKTLKSAVANAENNHDLDADDLVVKEATIGVGPTFKRFKPRARGSAGGILKRTSHIYITLGEREAEAVTAPKKKSPAAPKKKAAPVAAAPKAAEEEKPAADDRGQVYDSAPDNVDDLKQISGVGPALEEKLNGFGIYTFEQIANWTQSNIDTFDDLLSFKGRIERDNWITQAKEFNAS